MQPRVSLHAPPVLRATAGGREASMSNIIFWTALVVVPILVGTAYAICAISIMKTTSDPARANQKPQALL